MFINSSNELGQFEQASVQDLGVVPCCVWRLYDDCSGYRHLDKVTDYS
jgi:hypothetical protein